MAASQVPQRVLISPTLCFALCIASPKLRCLQEEVCVVVVAPLGVCLLVAIDTLVGVLFWNLLCMTHI